MTDETRNPTAPEPQPAPPSAMPSPTPAPPPAPVHSPPAADVRARRPDYRGEELDPERGPGLGCFWFQVIVLGFFIVLIPIGINLAWPYELLAFLLFIVLGLLLFTGQTVIFLLRLVAADRRSQGRRRPLASPTKTVGELEDEHRVAHAVGGERPVAASVATASPPAEVPADVPDAPVLASTGADEAEAASDADVPAAAETAADPAADETAADPAAADPGEPPEEPTPGVRQ